MTQLYLPIRQKTASPSPILQATEKQFNAEDVQEAFIDHKNRLVHAIDGTKSILTDLREFNKSSWVVRYPHFREKESTPLPSPLPSKRPSSVRRSMTFMDDPQNQTEVVFKRMRKGQPRSLSLASDVNAAEVNDAEEEISGLVPSKSDLDFNVLRLDLKMGPHGSAATASSLVSQLEKSSIANLLDDRIAASLKHVEKLRTRVEDTSSKVLVTGDLNAGKSTLVNSLLRREIMPVDQQPCTTAFCEVHDAAENGDKEEVHILTDANNYSVNDEATFKRASISDLEDLISENEDSQQMVKVYINDPRAASDSFLNNGIADISLIDAPGLNRDSVKTTALFARQEEIDVVVFVVSAENHFTLSAREFLETASREKAYVFIVVNKFEGIRNKDKCKRLVLEQVKELSPNTYEDAADLVHFVDSSAVLGVHPLNPAFESLESSLRSFVLLKRSKSKLHPAATYLTHLLADIDLLAGSNAILAKSELEFAKDSLNRVRPELEKMKNSREGLEGSLEQVEEDGASEASRNTKDILNQALELVGSGEPAVEHPLIPMPSYPGLFGIWDYVRDVRKALLASLDDAVSLAEDEARLTTTSRVKDISALGDRFLPEGVERSRRVFMPEAMFALHRVGKNGKQRRSSGAVVAGGIYGLGIGLAQRQDMLETSFLDIFDAHHQYKAYFGDKTVASAEDDEESLPSALSVVSVGVGALTMIGGKTLGMRSIIEGAVRITDLFGNDTARKWAAPVLGAFAIGLSVYFVLELPNTIPRTVGRRVRAALARADGDDESTTFVGAHALRVTRETRKVLRIASWEQRERFLGAMDERAKEVEGAEGAERQAEKALAWLGDVQSRTSDVRADACVVGDISVS
ncbi:hypothetical protein DFH11DRAFT_1593448 [Phellopilus nigrolimitatus]|nr:hypothetical protein DFH11DRAFT_1593448 [Phellopilus nigrolimitatus]